LDLNFFSKSALIQRAEDGSPPNDKLCHYAGKSPKINTHTLVLLIKIYSTDISAQKHANTLSICHMYIMYNRPRKIVRSYNAIVFVNLALFVIVTAYLLVLTGKVVFTTYSTMFIQPDAQMRHFRYMTIVT
jgi:hypothetical protein